MENMSMDSSMQRQSKAKKESPKRNYSLKKIDQETSKVLNQIREKANRKDFGRKVTDTEIISAGIKLLTQEHIKSLQEQTYSERDRLNIAHEEYQRAHGKLTLDQFIGKLLKGELKLA